MVEALLARNPQGVTVDEMSAQLDKTPGNIRKTLSHLGVRIETEQVPHSKRKVYRLSENAMVDDNLLARWEDLID